jgi:hypothetical protein
MSEITLAATKGDARMDALLREIVARFEFAFPGRVRGYYVIGGYGASADPTRFSRSVGRVIRLR